MAIFTNQATLTYSGGTVNSNVTTGEILEVLSATKTAVVDTYSQGSEVTYIVNIINSGNIAYSNLTLTDDLGAYTFDDTTLQPLDYIDGSVKYFIDGVLQARPTVTDGPPLVITGITVPAGGEATIAYAVEANSFAPPTETGTIENTAVVSGTGIADVTATETITATAEPELSITKSLTPDTVTENGQITYTFVISNTGNAPAVATDDVVITDTFDPILSNITVTYNGTVLTEPDDYTYDEATGLFTTVAGVITVPAATFAQDPETGEWTTEPGEAVLTVTGTV